MAMMNKFAKLMLVTLLCCSASAAMADIDADKAASKLYANKIALAKQEIKTLKAKLKVSPDMADSITLKMQEKKEELLQLQADKKVVDKNIAAEKANIKAQKAAEKAAAKAEQAKEKAAAAAQERSKVQ